MTSNYLLSFVVTIIFTVMSSVSHADPVDDINNILFGKTIGNVTQQVSDLTWKNTTWKEGPGFGDQWNKYAWSMQDFKGHMYVGTSNVHFDIVGALEDPEVQACVGDDFSANIFGVFQCLGSYQDTNGSEIWRYKYRTQKWQKVYGFEGDELSSGFRKMIVYKKKLYVSSSDFGNKAKLLVSKNGRTWTTIDNPIGLGPVGEGCWSYRALAVYNDKLYVGSDCGDLWSYDGADWAQVSPTPIGFPGGLGIAELAVYKKKLYIGSGAGAPGTGIGLHRVDKEGVIEDISPQATEVEGVNLAGLGNISVAKLYVFKGKLYVGTANFNRGFTFLSYKAKGDEWKLITADGFGYDTNTYTWSMAKYKNELYMGTFTSVFLQALIDENEPGLDLLKLLQPSAQLWRSKDGMAWEQQELPHVAFGVWNYGFRNMEVGNKGKSLFLGTGSNLFAPDADELLKLITEEVSTLGIPSFSFSDPNLLLTLNLLSIEPELLTMNNLLARLIGPGTQIWEVKSKDSLFFLKGIFN